MSRKQHHTLSFDSIADAVQFARTTPRASDMPVSSAKAKKADWDNGMSLKETINFCANGEVWQQGVDTMMGAMEVTDALTAKHLAPRIVRHVVGSSPSVGAYVTGHPRCMRRRTKQPAITKPVLGIGIPLGIYWGVTARQRLNFGAALLSAVDSLERAGYRCELIALWRASVNNRPGEAYINIEYNIKRPQDRWNPATFAFVLAHVAFQRRLTWRIAETQPQWREAIDRHYASNTNTPALEESLAADFDIYFLNMGPSAAKQCDTPEGAFTLVNDTLTRQMAALEAKQDAR